MKPFRLEQILRRNILELKPYASARSEVGTASRVMLDANENPLGAAFSRYPDPLQRLLKEDIAAIGGIAKDRIFIGNGSDEAIDLLVRISCRPATGDHILICPPTYGMYEVCARINDVGVAEVPLDDRFRLRTDAVLEALCEETKLVFICSPNNPSGNLMRAADVERIIEAAPGLVVVDEAYIDFADRPSLLLRLHQFPNLVVLQTLSKAWGLAGLRIGLAFASPELIAVLNKVKPPYNVSAASQDACRAALRKSGSLAASRDILLAQRAMLTQALQAFPFVRTVFPSDANFLLVRVSNAADLYEHLCRSGVVVRQRHGQPGCDNCLRITIGAPFENKLLLDALTEYQP